MPYLIPEPDELKMRRLAERIEASEHVCLIKKGDASHALLGYTRVE